MLELKPVSPHIFYLMLSLPSQSTWVLAVCFAAGYTLPGLLWVINSCCCQCPPIVSCSAPSVLEPRGWVESVLPETVLCSAYQVAEEANHEDWNLAGVVKDAPLKSDEQYNPYFPISRTREKCCVTGDPQTLRHALISVCLSVKCIIWWCCDRLDKEGIQRVEVSSLRHLGTNDLAIDLLSCICSPLSS